MSKWCASLEGVRDNYFDLLFQVVGRIRKRISRGV